MAISDKSIYSTTITQVRINNTTRARKTDVLAAEEPLEIRLGYVDQHKGKIHKSISITMRTPGQDVDLALGFLFSENIIRQASQVISIDTSRENVIRLELDENLSFDLARLERHFYTTSSCGICGKASLEALSMTGVEAHLNNQFQVSQQALLGLSDKLRSQQALFHRTGGNHATGLFNRQGEILAVTEDIGRHNAMDKLIGQQLSQQALPMAEMGIIVSGRASFELMQKALMAGCPMLVSVGAPSSLALELAEEFNLTLLGFLGAKGFNIYHGEENII